MRPTPGRDAEFNGDVDDVLGRHGVGIPGLVADAASVAQSARAVSCLIVSGTRSRSARRMRCHSVPGGPDRRSFSKKSLPPPRPSSDVTDGVADGSGPSRPTRRRPCSCAPQSTTAAPPPLANRHNASAPPCARLCQASEPPVRATPNSCAAVKASTRPGSCAASGPQFPRRCSGAPSRSASADPCR